jgi:hypothetical protein
MQITKNDKLATFYIERARKLITGDLVLKSVQYNSERQGIHLSDLQGCPAIPYYSRIYKDNKPPIPDNSVLFFLRGRQIERAFHENEISTICEGISCTADDQNEFGYTEIKSTAEQMDFFDPLKAHKEWIERILGYMYAFEQTTWHLLVFFIVGNMPNRLWWNIKDFGKSDKPYEGIALQAWTLEAPLLEIAENWALMQARKKTLEQCIETKTPPSDDYIEMMIEDWHHKTCQFKPVCEYYDKYVMQGESI